MLTEQPFDPLKAGFTERMGQLLPLDSPVSSLGGKRWQPAGAIVAQKKKFKVISHSVGRPLPRLEINPFAIAVARFARRSAGTALFFHLIVIPD